MRNRRPIRLLILSLLSITGLVFLILNFIPSSQFSILGFGFSVLSFALIALFLFIFSLFSFILNNKRRGALIAAFITGCLILKLVNLTHPFFIILFLILLVMVELLFAKRK